MLQLYTNIHFCFTWAFISICFCFIIILIILLGTLFRKKENLLFLIDQFLLLFLVLILLFTIFVLEACMFFRNHTFYIIRSYVYWFIKLNFENKFININ